MERLENFPFYDRIFSRSDSMVYNYFVFYKENHDFITITHDFYNKNVDVYYNKQKIFSSPLKKCKTKETFDFTYQEKNYRLFVNTHHFFFFKKVKFQLYEENVLLQKSKYKSKTWDVATKKASYHIHVLYNDFTSSMKVTINDQLIYDSLDKVKAFEPSVRKMDYDNQVFRFIKKKVENELFSLVLKMNSRDELYCKEDLLFIQFFALLKRNSRKVRLFHYLKANWLEILCIPLFLFACFCLHLFVFSKAQMTTTKTILTLLLFLGIAFALVILMYLIGFIFYKRRFKN